jgi:hypothetical protein
LPPISRRNFIAITGGTLLASAPLTAATDVPAQLDHILLGCRDLDSGIDFVERQSGVRADFGGVHPGRGTRNALLSLGDTHYLEIIAPDPAQSSAGDFRGLRSLTEPRIIGWAAHPGDLDSFAARLRMNGVAAEGPQPGSRKRPDGRVLNWKTLTLKDNCDSLLPFFIEWRAGSTHPSADAPTGAKLSQFELASPDVAGLERICELLDLDVRLQHAPKPQIRARISGSSGQSLQLSS